ncbi:pentapeptide repeat-containing protein [Desulfosarcina sp. OttesenSCG-928-G10]|nr:pentapeptide repeat-containing protein [Desulfosarcina sp. OttesenSCG-928-G10]
MNNRIVKTLRERWPTEIDFEINKSLKKENWQDKRNPNSRWNVHPFGMTESGKIDFRGFPFREQIKYQYVFGIDFSYSDSLSEFTEGYGASRGEAGISFSIFENCDFMGSDMPANLSEKFIDCNFSHAKFDSTRMNGLFESCLFSSSKIKNVIGNMKFVNCNFSKATFSQSNFYSCYFESCIFDDANFSRANISGSTFVNTKPSGQQLESCILKEKIKFL